MRMFRLRNNIDEIVQDYEDAHIETESLKFYKEANKIFNKELKRTDKLDKELRVIQRGKKQKDEEYRKIKKEIKKLREKHQIKTGFATIPLIGRIPELIGNIGRLPIIKNIPIVKNIGEIGSVEREYHELQKRLRFAKNRKRMYEKNEKNLMPVLKKYNKQLKIDEKDLKKCKKTLKDNYKIDKTTIEISRLYETNKKLLKLAYDKESMKYIEEYVEAIRAGNEPEILPQGIVEPKDMKKHLKKALENKRAGKPVKTLKFDNNTSQGRNKREDKSDVIPQGTFAKMGLDIKRDYVNMTMQIKGQKVDLSPEETLAYLGMIKDYPDGMDIIKQIKDKDIDLTQKEELGWNALKDMIDRARMEKNVDPNTLSAYEKNVYGVAKEYIKQEESHNNSTQIKMHNQDQSRS